MKTGTLIMIAIGVVLTGATIAIIASGKKDKNDSTDPKNGNGKGTTVGGPVSSTPVKDVVSTSKPRVASTVAQVAPPAIATPTAVAYASANGIPEDSEVL